MRTDAPAALPLVAYVAGLVLGHSWRDACALFAIAILLLMLRRMRDAIAVAALAFGVGVSANAARVAVIEGMDSDGFVFVDAPIERDWMQRGQLFTLRASRFRVNGRDVRQPITLNARFPPPAIRLDRRVVVEGFLRPNERGEATVAIKSPRLLRYEGRLSSWNPRAWNRALANRLRPYAETHPTEVALVEALALGRSERLTLEIRDSYKRAGTYHLLVFSGLQIALAAGAMGAVLRWTRSPRMSDWSLLLFAVLAPLFIGANASVARASIAIGLFAVSRLMHRPTTLGNLWCVAALMRLAMAPSDITDPAFQLTYGGAGALLFVAKPLATRPARWIAYAAGVECVVAPITLFHFRQYAAGGSITTIALTPVVSLMLIASVIACVIPSPLTLRAVGVLHAIALRVNDVAAKGAGILAAPPAVAFATALIAALIAIALLTGRARATAIVACMIVPIACAVFVATRDVDGPRLTLLDVGQGDAILLRTPGHVILVDGGVSGPRLLPMLADRGVRRIDAVVLTHVHPDHCGGIPSVLSRLPVGELWISPRRFTGDCAQEVLATAADAAIPIHLTRDGDRLRIPGISLRAIVPATRFRRAAENNSSIVLAATIGKRRALLTGDIERDAERLVAASASCVDILKVAHHGSRTSTTPLIVDAVAPRIALISCGRRNLFGHPHREVLETLRSRHVRTWRTDRDGTIDIDVDADHIAVRHQIDTP